MKLRAVELRSGPILLLVFSLLACLGACENEERVSPEGTRTFTFELDDPLYVGELELELDIEHATTANLVVRLTHIPSRVTVPVFFAPKGTGRDARLTLADSADRASYYAVGESGASTFDGAAYRPYVPLGFFRGEVARGPWGLEIENLDKESAAVVNSYELRVTGTSSPQRELVVAEIYDHWQSAPAGVTQEFVVRYRAPEAVASETEIRMLGDAVVESRSTGNVLRYNSNAVRAGMVHYRLQPGTYEPNLTLVVEAGDQRVQQDYRPRFVDPPANNMALRKHVPRVDLGFPGGFPVALESWTDDATGRDFAVVWTRKGTSFVEIADEGVVSVLDALEPADVATAFDAEPALAIHEDIAFVAHEGGLQVVELAPLLGMRPGTTTSMPEGRVVAAFDSAKSLVVDSDREILYAIGACNLFVPPQGCHDMMAFDISEPAFPVQIGRLGFAFRSDTSGALCGEFDDRPICFVTYRFSFDGSGDLAAWDVSDPQDVRVLDREWITTTVSPLWLEQAGEHLIVGGPTRESAPATGSVVFDLGDPAFLDERFDIELDERRFGQRLFVRDEFVFEAIFAGGVRVYPGFAGAPSLDPADAIASYDGYTDDNLGKDGASPEAFAGAADIEWFPNKNVVAIVDPLRGLFLLDLAIP